MYGKEVEFRNTGTYMRPPGSGTAVPVFDVRVLGEPPVESYGGLVRLADCYDVYVPASWLYRSRMMSVIHILDTIKDKIVGSKFNHGGAAFDVVAIVPGY